jgi:hypothetical protein
VDKTTLGETLIMCYCCSYGKQTRIYVMKVDMIVKAGTIDEGPLYVCLNSTVDLEAKPCPSGVPFPSGEPCWLVESQPEGANASLTPSCGSVTTTLGNLTKAGNYIVGANCGSGTGDAITVTAVEVDQIHIEYAEGMWDDITGETIVVLKGTKYTFKALPNPSGATWPANQPTWSGVASGTGETIEVTFDSTGTKTLTCKSCNEPGKSVTIEVLTPTVYRVGFGNDYTLYKTPATWDGWGDGETAITQPVYDSDAVPAKNDPVCVTKNSSAVSLTDVRLKVTEALSYPITITVDASGTEDWNEYGVLFSDKTSGEATLGITGNIINQVKKYNNDFQNQWKYKVPSGTNTWYTINTTSHTVYVTYDAPSPGGAELTVKRIDWACEKADGATTESAVANGIHNGLGNVDPPREPGECSPQTLSDDWSLLAGCPYYGWCNDQADLMEKGVEILGPSAISYLTFASKHDDPSVTTPDDKWQDGKHWWLKFDFDNNGEVDNNFEGSVSAGGHCYAVWPKLDGASECGLLRAIGPDSYGATQRWVRTFGDTFYGETLEHLPGTESYPICP